jgi:hypothetical protein
MADTGERQDLYGPAPVGRLILTDDGRMTAIGAAADRTPRKDEPAELAYFRTMMAYSGVWRLAGGDTFVTQVDVAWHPAWSGEMVRYFRLEGDLLSIRTAPQTHPSYPGRSVCFLVEWRREK